MKKLSRLFLLCILMLAIPVQGIAAASMLFCAGGHQHVAQAGQQDKNLHQHHDMSAAGKSADHKTDSNASLAKDKCSSCAACCVGAALVTAFPEPAISSPSSEKIDLVFSSHLGHISDGLERPPRA